MRYQFFSMFLKFITAGIILFLSSVFTSAQSIQGCVFIDSNHNALMDYNEKGLSGIIVSNQKDVVLTDENGFFELKLIEGNYIFVTKPSGYQFKLDNYFNPEFYFLYKTKKTKDPIKYKTTEPIAEIPDKLFFPVYQTRNEDEHMGLLIGDIQMASEKQVDYYQEGIIPYLANKNADFYVELGDIVHDNLSLYPKEKKITGSLGIPGYRVFGNHDLNYKASKNKNASETFNSYYGPDYYSFNYGNFHYIILNNITYDGWWDNINAPGTYSGGIDSEQIKWLTNNLSKVSPDKSIVLFSHIPLHEAFIGKLNMKHILKALENHNNILAVSGHLHNILAFDYNVSHNHKDNFNFEGLVAGAACGAWWSGDLDQNGIPFSTCTDGSPKGFFQLTVNKNNYEYVFYPVNYPCDFQMRTFVKENEIWVNWFVGKRQDSVMLYLDNNPEPISLQNFTGTDPFMESKLNNSIHLQSQIKNLTQTTHLWKTILPENLAPGYHSIKIVAKDSKGKLFNGFKTFYTE